MIESSDLTMQTLLRQLAPITEGRRHGVAAAVMREAADQLDLQETRLRAMRAALRDIAAEGGGSIASLRALQALDADNLVDDRRGAA